MSTSLEAASERIESGRREAVAPELELLLRCLDSDVRFGGRSSLAAFVESNELDWQIFLSLLIRHRVLLPVYRVLKERDLLLLLDASARVRIAERARMQQLTQLKRVAALVNIREAFVDSGIEFLCLKGPALSQWLFGDPLVREFGDLDILVRDRDLRTAAKILEEIGFVSDDPFDWSGAATSDFVLKRLHHAHFSRSETRVELHWRISQNDALFDDPIESFFRRKQLVAISGVEFYLFGMPDLMRYLTVHGSSHCWNRIKWLYDVKTLRDVMHENNGTASCLDEDSKASLLREGLLECFWHSELDGGNIKTKSYMRSLCLRQITAAEEYPGSVSNMLRRSFLLLWLHRGLRAKINYLTSLLIWPPVFEKVSLPKRLALLYIILGPIYWIIGRARSVMRRR